MTNFTTKYYASFTKDLLSNVVTLFPFLSPFSLNYKIPIISLAKDACYRQ